MTYFPYLLGYSRKKSQPIKTFLGPARSIFVLWIEFFDKNILISISLHSFLIVLRWCLTCLSGGFLRIKFRFFSEFVNESSFSENENLGISFERFLPIFRNPHACTGGQSQQTIAPVSFQNYTRSSNPSSQKTESLFQKNWKEIEFPFNLKSSKLAARTSTIISKKKN